MNTFKNEYNLNKDDYEYAHCLCALLQSKGYVAVFAGGVVRDYLSNFPYNDIDIATNCLPDVVESILKSNNYKVKSVGKSFGVILVTVGIYEFEIATFRLDKDCNGRHPDSIEFCSMEEDAKRRDFTINALYYDPISKNVYDFVCGIHDIENKILRFVGTPENRIKEDYLRLLRYIRFRTKGYITDFETDKIVNVMALDFNTFVAKDRISKELIEKILTKDVSKFMNNLKDYPNLFIAIFKSVYDKEVTDALSLNYLIERVHHADSKLVNYKVYLALLYINIDIVTVRYELGEMRFSNADIDYVSGLITYYKSMFETISISDLKKLKASNIYDDLIIVCDIMISDITDWLDIISIYNHNKSLASSFPSVLPPPIFTGTDIMELLGIKPSPIFSTILDTVYTLQLNEIMTTKEECVMYIKGNIL